MDQPLDEAKFDLFEYPLGELSMELPAGDEYPPAKPTPMDLLFDRQTFLTDTSKFTSEQLNGLLDLTFTAIRIRQMRRQAVTAEAIKNAVEIYIRNNPFIVDGVEVHFNYFGHFTPGNEDRRKYVPPEICVTFNYGESYTGRVFEHDREESTHDPEYKLVISWQYMTLCPPVHHVVVPPVLRTEEGRMRFSSDITDDVAIKWINKYGRTPMQITQPDKKTRNDVYGDLLRPFIQHFITDKHANGLLETACRVYRAYHMFPIAKAKAATMTFLIIGRCKKLCGESGTAICYDVIKMIAQMVWASRTDQALWSIVTPDVDGYRLVSEDVRDIYEDNDTLDENIAKIPVFLRNY